MTSSNLNALPAVVGLHTVGTVVTGHHLWGLHSPPGSGLVLVAASVVVSPQVDQAQTAQLVGCLSVAQLVVGCMYPLQTGVPVT